MTGTKLDMVKNNDDELETTTADETDINDSLSNCSSDVELDFDKTNKILKAKLNDKVIEGKIVDFTNDFEIMVQTDNKTEVFNSGEVSFNY